MERPAKSTLTAFHEIGVSGSCDDSVTAKKRFIFRFLRATHSSGNFCFRSEKYISRIGRAYDLHTQCVILPTSATVTFQDSYMLNSASYESYNVKIKGGWNVYKLSLLDSLYYDIYRNKLPFEEATLRLANIGDIEDYPWYVTMLSFGSASFAAAILFFGGNGRDGGISFVMGIIAYAVSIACSHYKGLAEIECFLTAFSISLVSAVLDIHVYQGALCLYAIMFGGVVWSLPGIRITLSLIEIYSRMYAFGSSTLIYGISLASQIGFGLTFGYNLIAQQYDLPYSFQYGCRDPVSLWFGFILLPIISISCAVIMNGDISQFFGIVLVSGAGQFMATMLSLSGMNPAGVSFIAAMTVTAAARLYAYLGVKKRPLVYIYGGLLVLVPGGMAVRGMSNMWSNAQTGMEFTFQMMLIGVSLAIGVFFAMLPSRKWAIVQVNLDHGSDIDGHIHLTVINPLRRRDTLESDEQV